jgi:hypothetical protein
MINLKAAAKTAGVVALVGMGVKIVATFPYFFAYTLLTLGGIFAVSIIYRIFDDRDKNKIE